jgi:hypothetical protein
MQNYFTTFPVEEMLSSTFRVRDFTESFLSPEILRESNSIETSPKHLKDASPVGLSNFWLAQPLQYAS